VLVLAAFVAGCMTFVAGVWAGRGSGSLLAHMTWGALTLVLQLFALGVTTVHARYSEQRIAGLLAELEKRDRLSTDS
jgi:hypothetical protein